MLQLPLDAAFNHARNNFPDEGGGFFVQTGNGIEYMPAKYVSKVRDHFAFTPYEWLDMQKAGKLVGIFHTHCNWPPIPSPGDMQSLEAWGVPWVIASLPSEEWCYFEPQGIKVPPFIGRPFVHQHADCFTLIRDVYATMGIDLPYVIREPLWWKKGGNLYMELYESAGFVPVRDLQVNDMILMQIDAPVPNHAALYIGDNRILHHLFGHLSARGFYGSTFRKYSTMILRHRDLCSTPL